MYCLPCDQLVMFKVALPDSWFVRGRYSLIFFERNCWIFRWLPPSLLDGDNCGCMVRSEEGVLPWSASLMRSKEV